MIKFFFKVKEPLGHSMVVFQCQVKNFGFIQISIIDTTHLEKIILKIQTFIVFFPYGIFSDFFEEFWKSFLEIEVSKKFDHHF